MLLAQVCGQGVGNGIRINVIVHQTVEIHERSTLIITEDAAIPRAHARVKWMRRQKLACILQRALVGPRRVGRTDWQKSQNIVRDNDNDENAECGAQKCVRAQNFIQKISQAINEDERGNEQDACIPWLHRRIVGIKNEITAQCECAGNDQNHAARVV